MADVIQKIFDIQLNYDGVVQKLVDLTKRNEELSKSEKELKKQFKDQTPTKQYAQTLAAINQEKKKNTDAINKYTKAFQQEIKLHKDEIASVSPLIDRLDALSKKFNELSAKEQRSAAGRAMSKEMADLATQINQSTQKIAQQTTTLEKSKTSINSLKTTIEDLRNEYMSLSETERKSGKGTALLEKIRNTTTEYKTQVDVLKKATSGFNQNADSVNALRENLKTLLADFDKLSKVQREGAGGKQLRKDIEETRKEIQKAEEATGRYGRNVGNYMSALKGFGMRSLNIIGGVTTIAQGFVKLGDAMKQGIKDAIEYNREISKLAAILQTTSDGVSKLDAQAKALGASTRYTAKEVASLQIELAKLGYTQSQIVNMSKSVLLLAQATGSNLADAASLAGAALRIWGEDSSKTTEYVDQMAVATAKSALSFDYIKTALPIVGGAAEMFGFTLKDTLALIAQLANSGMEASMAATATRNIFLKLADANGILAKELGKQPKTFDELIDGLKELRARGANLNDALELTNVRAAVSFTRFLKSADSARELSKELGNCSGAAEQMAKVMEDNLGGDITRLSSAWTDFTLSLNKSQGPLRTAVNWLTSLVRKLGDFMRGVKESRNAGIVRATTEFSDPDKEYMKHLIDSDYTEYIDEINKLKAKGIKQSEAEEKAYDKIIAKIDKQTKSMRKSVDSQEQWLDSMEEGKMYAKKSDEWIEGQIRLFEKERMKFLQKGQSQSAAAKKRSIDEYKTALQRRKAYYAQAGKLDAQNDRKEFFTSKTAKQETNSGLGIVDDKTRRQRDKNELDAYRRYYESLLALTEEGMNKQIATITKKYDVEKKTIEEKLKDISKLTPQAVEYYENALKNIEIAKDREIAETRKKFDKQERERLQKEIEQRIKMATEGSNEEFELRKQLLASQKDAELNPLQHDLNLKREDLTKLNLKQGIYKILPEETQEEYEERIKKMRQNITDELTALEKQVIDIETKYDFEDKKLQQDRKDRLNQAMVNDLQMRISAEDSELERLEKNARLQEEIYSQMYRKIGESEDAYLVRKTEAFNNMYNAQKALADKEYQMRVATANAIAGTFGTIAEAIVACDETSEESARAAKILGLAEIYIQQGIAIANAVRSASESSITVWDLIANIATAITTTTISTAKAFASINKAKFAKGAVNIQGPGTETSDSIDARLSKGESVMTAKATKMFGNLLSIMNNIAAQPNVTLPTQYSSYNPMQTSISNDAITEGMREAVAEIKPVVSVVDINDATQRVNNIKVLDTF